MEDVITLLMYGGGYGVSLNARRAKCRASHQEGSRSSLLAFPPGKGLNAANESKGGSDPSVRTESCLVVSVAPWLFLWDSS